MSSGDYDFVSFNGYAGGGELGLILEGFNLKHRAGDSDFGWIIPETNRKTFGWEWDSHFTRDKNIAREDVRSARFLYSNCKCSAWSTLSRKDLRGESASVLEGTDRLYEYAANMTPAPEIIALESVQQAYSTGRAYYQRKRDELEEKTGHKYDIIWTHQSNASLGGSSVRRRTFIVFTRIPFGVEYAQPARVTRFRDSVEDLRHLNLTPAKQRYKAPPTWWSTGRRASDGVDGHWNDSAMNRQYAQLMDMAAEMGSPWLPGEPSDGVLKRVYDRYGYLPEGWKLHLLERHDFKLGINQTTMWNPDKFGNVVTGSGYMHTVHYAEHRLMTHREMFRLQGWPDTVRLWPARDYKKLIACPGKGVPVDAGRWIGEWVKRALDGNPGTQRGKEIGWREYKYDITNSYKRTLKYETPWRYSQHTNYTHDHQTPFDTDMTA